jgi:hypothetical protein
MTTPKLTPAEECARFEKFARDLNEAIYRLTGELAADLGKSPGEILEISSKVASAGVSACVQEFDSIA